jgi:flagellar basal-body rod protein FlgC
MISALNSSMSALHAHAKKLAVTVHNIANVSSEGYKKYTATMEEDALGGVKVDIRRVVTPGQPYEVTEDGRSVAKETSNADLSQEIPNLMMAQRGYEANIKILQTRGKVLGSLLDITT